MVFGFSRFALSTCRFLAAIGGNVKKLSGKTSIQLRFRVPFRARFQSSGACIAGNYFFSLQDGVVNAWLFAEWGMKVSGLIAYPDYEIGAIGENGVPQRRKIDPVP
jgi:hypothetical protein